MNYNSIIWKQRSIVYFHLSIIPILQENNLYGVVLNNESVICGNYHYGMVITTFEGNDIKLKIFILEEGEIYQLMNIDVDLANDKAFDWHVNFLKYFQMADFDIIHKINLNNRLTMKNYNL